MPANESNTQVRAYFLRQGASIAKLHSLLDSSLFIHHLKKWLSILIEISLYLLFASIVLGTMFIPTELTEFITLDESTHVGVTLHNKDFDVFVLILKLSLVLISLPILLFAMLLGRNRKKNALLHEAFTEVKKMKEGFDGAVKGLGL